MIYVLEILKLRRFRYRQVAGAGAPPSEEAVDRGVERELETGTFEAPIPETGEFAAIDPDPASSTGRVASSSGLLPGPTVDALDLEQLARLGVVDLQGRVLDPEALAEHGLERATALVAVLALARRGRGRRARGSRR